MEGWSMAWGQCFQLSHLKSVISLKSEEFQEVKN